MDQTDHFPDGTHFDHVMSIYSNDQWLRNKYLLLLEPIEVSIKTMVAYHLGMTYGSECFYNSQIYKNEKTHKKIVQAFMNEQGRNRDDPVIKHHIVHYEGKFPIWVVVEFLSFNSISKLFNNLFEKDKKLIALAAFSVNENYLASWLHALSVFRNICAHYGFLYKRELAVSPRLFKDFAWDIQQNKSVFALSLVIKKISESSLWREFIIAIDDKEHKSSSFHLSDYGFPRNWRKYLMA